MLKTLTKFGAVLLVIITALTSGGFLYGEADVKNTTVVQGVGIDYDKKTKEYAITVEIFDISLASNADQSQPGNLTRILKVRGKTVASAMNKITLEIGKTLIFSQKRIVVIGRDAVEQGVANSIDFFVRDYKTRSSVYIATTNECTAEDILRCNEGNASFPARELQTLLESGDINGYTANVNFARFIDKLKSKFSSAYLPVLNKRTDGKAEFAYLDGIMVIKNEKPAGILDMDESRGLLFARDDIDGGIVSIENEKIGTSTLRIVSNKTRISIEMGEKPQIKIKIKCIADIIEMQFHDDSGVMNSDAEVITKNAEKYIKRIVDDALQKCLDECGTDVFDFGERVWILYPSRYKNRESDLRKSVKSKNVDVEVEVDVRRMGQGNT